MARRGGGGGGDPLPDRVHARRTDAKAMAQTRGGVPAATIGLPRRYSHSPVEVFALRDLENLVKILVAAVKRLEKGFSLIRA